MNQEAVFALRFVVKDLAKMRKGIEQVNKNLKNMQKNANNASRGIEKVNSSFGKAARSALKFAAAYFTISKIMGSVFSKANEALQLNEMAISAGVATDKIGKLGKALKLYGGDARSAGAAYASLTNIIGGAKHGMGISEDVAKVNAMFGIGFNYGNISQDQLMTEIAKAMHRLKKNGDSWGINQIASAYGLNADVAALLATHGANWKNVVSAEKWEQMNMSEAQRLIKAQEDLEESLNSAIMKIVPLLTDLINVTSKIVEYLRTSVGKWKLPAPKPANYGVITDENFEKHQRGLLESGKITKEEYDEVMAIRAYKTTTTPVSWATEALKNKYLASSYADYIQNSANPLEEMENLSRLGKVNFDFLPLASGPAWQSRVGGQVTRIELINNTGVKLGARSEGIPVNVR